MTWKRSFPLRNFDLYTHEYGLSSMTIKNSFAWVLPVIFIKRLRFYF